MSERCECDACDELVADGAALCEFCTAHCYPVAATPGGRTRVVFDAGSRDELHARRARDQQDAARPVAERMLAEAAERLGQAARQRAEKLVADGARALRKALLGR